MVPDKRVDFRMHESGRGSDAMASHSQAPVYEDRQLVKWMETQSKHDQERVLGESFKHLLEKAGEPRHASNNACIKLCYFLEQCRSSSSSTIRYFVFSKVTCLGLFNFYIEWNEKNQNRSMRQVLEVLSSLIARNPDIEIATALKAAICQRTLAIITHQAAQPLVKPAFKCLEYLMSKGTISPDILRDIYERKYEIEIVNAGLKSLVIEELSWSKLFDGIFEWMTLPDISPAAGKFLVTVFRGLKDQNANSTVMKTNHSALWQRWISNGLAKNPESLENVKNYLFPALFKLDRTGSIVFLEHLNTVTSSKEACDNFADTYHLLRLSAMEMGKKSGLIEEPATLHLLDTSKKSSATIVLAEETLKPLISHSSETVRSLAFSVLVSSLSSTRPFTPVALQILESRMEILYSDPDAKFRNEVLSNTKHMIERLRGATSFMARELEHLSYEPSGPHNLDDDQKQEQIRLRGGVAALLLAHENFIAWYLNFLLGELVPTASYQRHITALRATILLLYSGIHDEMPASVRVSGNATSWPFSIHFFTPGAVKLLMDLLLDPFEDVRSAAADILKLATTKDFVSRTAMKTNDSSNWPQKTQLALKSLTSSTSLSDLPARNIVSTSENPSTIAETSKTFKETPLGTHQELFRINLLPGELAKPLSLATSINAQDSEQKPVELPPCKSEAVTKQKQQKIDVSPVIVVERRAEDISPSLLLDFIEYAKEISQQTGRADYADGLARSFELLYSLQSSAAAQDELLSQLVDDLEGKVQLAENNLGWAVLKAPIHGHFAILRIIWESPALAKNLAAVQPHDLHARHQLNHLQQRMIRACLHIWQAVKEILCNDSPEGHLPEELDESELVDTKNVLSYSFRSIHESSNLLRSIATKVKKNLSNGAPLLSVDLFEQIGDLTFEQLSSLRHRGAFSTVSLTFAVCCQLTQYKSSATSSKTSDRLKTWYKDTLICINQQVSTTRRSAGIPALITGIMEARSSDVSPPTTINELIEIARRPVPMSTEEVTHLPQVHALNSLKESFKNSSLRELCDPYVDRGIELAATSLESPIWAIRNCGLLLLRSLIDTLFGTSVSKSEIEDGWDGRSVKIQYERYPELLSLLKKLLDHTKDAGSMNEPELVLPALDIIRRAGPPSGDTAQFLIHVTAHLGSPHWQIREMAGRALCALTMDDDVGIRVTELLRSPRDNANFRHGALHAAKCIIERRATLDPLDVARKIDEIHRTWMNEASLESSSVPNPFIHAELNKVKIALLTAALDASIIPVFCENLSDEEYSDLVVETFKSVKPSSQVGQTCLHQLLLVAALKGDYQKVQEISDRATKILDPDAVLEMLSVLPKILNSDTELARIARIYADIYIRHNHSDIRGLVLSELSKSLQAKFVTGVPHEDVHRTLLNIRSSPGRFSDTPLFLSSWINLSGWVMLFNIIQTQRENNHAHFNAPKELADWINMIQHSGKATQNFDTRFAAVKSMQVVLPRLDPKHAKHENILPLLFVLYDTLNDDDEEIRRAGATIVSGLANVSMMSLAAARWLAEDMMLPAHGTTVDFALTVVSRITGAEVDLECGRSLIPLTKQLDFAPTRDDTLFTEEQPNLYIDECREVEFWANILNQLPRQIKNGKQLSPWFSSPINAMLKWATEGLGELVRISDPTKAPFKLDPNPATFTAFKRVIACITVLSRYEQHMLNLAPKMNFEREYKEWQEMFDVAFNDLSLLVEYSTKHRFVFHPSLFIELLKIESPKTWLRDGYNALFRQQNTVAPTIVPVKRASLEQL